MTECKKSLAKVWLWKKIKDISYQNFLKWWKEKITIEKRIKYNDWEERMVDVRELQKQKEEAVNNRRLRHIKHQEMVTNWKK